VKLRQKKVMKSFLLLLIAICAAASSVRANLGDSEARISASYGKPTGKLPGIAGTVGSYLYEKGDYTYNVIFRDGVSVFEMYTRANQHELSPSEIATFLKANAAGATWVLAGDKPAGREWKRSDHRAKAAYLRMAGRPTLTVMEATGKSRK
jgi:hypothetical protein